VNYEAITQEAIPPVVADYRYIALSNTEKVPLAFAGAQAIIRDA